MSEEEVYCRLDNIIKVLNSLKETKVYNKEGDILGICRSNEEDSDDMRFKKELIDKLYSRINRYKNEYKEMQDDIYKKSLNDPNIIREIKNYNKDEQYMYIIKKKEDEYKRLLQAFILTTNILYDEYLSLIGLYHIDPLINYNV